MTTEWRSTNEVPDWQDGGHVELRRSDGTIVTGFLAAVDEAFDGEGEYPVWELTLDGTDEKADMYDFESYRQSKRT